MESRFDGLRAVFFNGTLERSPEPSTIDGLVRLSADLMARHGVEVEVIRPSTATSRSAWTRT